MPPAAEYLLVYAGEPCHVMRGCTLKDAESHADETGAHTVVPAARKSSGADPPPGVEGAQGELGRLRAEVRRLRAEARRLRGGGGPWVDSWTSPPLHFVVSAHRPCVTLCKCTLEAAEEYAEGAGALAVVTASRCRLKSAGASWPGASRRSS